jgi:hypothetical protein
MIHAENKLMLQSLLCVDDHSILDTMLTECNEDFDLTFARMTEMGYEGFSIKRKEVPVPSAPPSSFLEHIVRTTRARTPGIDPEAFLCLELNGAAVVIQAVHTQQAELASELIARHVERMMAPAVGTAEPRAYRHIFVDNSNLFIGRSQKHLRINVPELTRLLTKGVDGLRIMAGSDDSARGGRWVEQWKGYRIQIAARQGSESMVDEFLHAQIYHCCLGNRVDARVTTIVLVTGDGNGNGGLSNFPRVVEQLRPFGFRFEVWAWRASLSQRLRDSCDECCLLDDVAHSVFA